MNTTTVNLVRNGDFELCEWDYQPGYPQVQLVNHLGRSAAHCRADAENVLFRQTIGQVEPGHYLASLSLAAGTEWPPYQFLMQILLEGQTEFPEIRIGFYRERWEGHWLEFDVPEATTMRIEISRYEPIPRSDFDPAELERLDLDSTAAAADRVNELFFTNVSIVRLGDLPSH